MKPAAPQDAAGSQSAFFLGMETKFVSARCPVKQNPVLLPTVHQLVMPVRYTDNPTGCKHRIEYLATRTKAFGFAEVPHQAKHGPRATQVCPANGLITLRTCRYGYSLLSEICRCS